MVFASLKMGHGHSWTERVQSRQGKSEGLQDEENYTCKEVPATFSLQEECEEAIKDSSTWFLRAWRKNASFGKVNVFFCFQTLVEY